MDSGEVSKIKAARTTAKRAVTNAAKRLQQAVELQLSSTPQLVSSLELKLNEFNALCDEFNSIVIENSIPEKDTLVNGLSPDQYESET